MKMLNYKQTEFLFNKYEEGLIKFRTLVEDGTFWEMADPEWLWENTEPANDVKFVEKNI